MDYWKRYPEGDGDSAASSSPQLAPPNLPVCLQECATKAGSLYLEGIKVISMSRAFVLDMSATGINSLSPNVGPAGGTTHVSVQGDSDSTFDANRTRVVVRGTEQPLNLYDVTPTRMQFELVLTQHTPPLLLMVKGGSNALPFYSYDPNLVRVTSCSPAHGKQVGGEAGGGAVVITVNSFDEILSLPGLHLTDIWCRFGSSTSVVVQADEYTLRRSKLIRCMPPETPTVGQVDVSVSLNGGQHWLDSCTRYLYEPVYKIIFVMKLNMLLSSWTSNEINTAQIESSMLRHFNSPQIVLSVLAWGASTLLGLEITVNSVTDAELQHSVLQSTQAGSIEASGTEVGGNEAGPSENVDLPAAVVEMFMDALSVSPSVGLLSNGPAISVITPNVGPAGPAVSTVVTLTGDSNAAFASTTQVAVTADSTNSVEPEVLSPTSLKINIEPRPRSGQVMVSIVGGSNMRGFYHYDPNVVRVTSCSPNSGEQIGGLEVVNVAVSALDQILTVPGLDYGEIKCRFGESLEVTVDDATLRQSRFIACMPPESPAVGDVELSVSFNGGQHWLKSDTIYSYKPVYQIVVEIRLDFPFDDWPTRRAQYEADIKASVNCSSVKTTAYAGSTVVNTEITIDDLVAAADQLDGLSTQAASGTLSLGGTSVMSMTEPVIIVSNGPSIASVSPNIASAAPGATTTITVIGDSSSSFDSTTRMTVSGVLYIPRVLSSNTLVLDVSSLPAATSLAVTNFYDK